MADIYQIDGPGGVFEIEADHEPTQAEVLKAVRAHGDATAEAEQKRLTAGPDGSAVGRLASNAWDMVNPVAMVKGTYNIVRHPVDTLTSIAERRQQEWDKSKQAFGEGRYTEAAARAVTGAVPVIGPLVADIGEQVGQGDYAGAAGKVAGLSVPFAAEKALATRAATQVGKAGTLEREAAQQVADRVLAPGNPKYKGTAKAIAPEILERKLSGNRLELQQVAEDGMAEAGTRIDQAIQDAGGIAAPIPAQDIIARLRRSVTDLQDSSGKPLSGQAAKRISAINERINQIRSLGGRSGMVSFEDLRKIRDENYDLAARAKAFEKTGNPILSDEGWAANETGHAVRETFATRSPAQAAANADFTFFKNLNDVLDPVKGRPKSMVPSQGITGGARTTGAVAGYLTGSKVATFVLSTVLPWMKERMADSSWQLADANRKMRLAQAMKKGDIGTMQSLMVNWGKGAAATTSPSVSQMPTEPMLGTP
jgi:hypothetical protein